MVEGNKENNEERKSESKGRKQEETTKKKKALRKSNDGSKDPKIRREGKARKRKNRKYKQIKCWKAASHSAQASKPKHVGSITTS